MYFLIPTWSEALMHIWLLLVMFRDDNAPCDNNEPCDDNTTCENNASYDDKHP